MNSIFSKMRLGSQASFGSCEKPMSSLSLENSRKLYNPALELLKWLVTQTVRQRLLWDSGGYIISTELRDATTIQFLVQPSESGSKDWSLFTVHSSGGQRLLNVTRDANSVSHSSLTAAIDALFMAIDERSSAPAGVQPTPSMSVSPRRKPNQLGAGRLPISCLAPD